MNVNVIRTAILMVVISLVLGILGCSSQASTTTTDSNSTTQVKTLKYGFSSAFSGPGAAWGVDFFRGHELAVDLIREKGGLKVGNDKYMIDLIHYDHKYSGTEGVAVANRLVFQDNVKFMTIHLGAAVIPSLPITEANKVMVMAAAFAKGIVDPANPLTFRGQYTDLMAADGIYGYIADNKKDVKNVAIVSMDDDTGKSALQKSTDKASSKGFNIVAKELAPRGTQDYYPLLAKVLAVKPDLIDCGSMSPGDLGIFAKQAREKGYKGLICVTGSVDVTSLVKVAGSSAEGIMTPELDYTGDMTTPEQKELAAMFTQKYGESMTPTAGSGEIMLEAWAAGVEAAQSIDPEVIAEKMPNITFKAQGVDMSWGGEKTYGIKHQIVLPIWVSEVQGDKLVTVGKFNPPVP